jgi:hypothetical protein
MTRAIPATIRALARFAHLALAASSLLACHRSIAGVDGSSGADGASTSVTGDDASLGSTTGVSSLDDTTTGLASTSPAEDSTGEPDDVEPCQWQPAEVLTGPDGEDLRLVVDAAGAVTAAWHDGTSMWVRRHDEGTGWGEPLDLGPDPSVPRYRLQGRVDGRVAVMWADGPSVAQWDPSRGAWEPPVLLGLGGLQAMALAFDDDDGLVAVWTDDYEVVIRRARWTAMDGWGAVEQIPTEYADVHGVDVAPMANGELGVLLHQVAACVGCNADAAFVLVRSALGEWSDPVPTPGTWPSASPGAFVAAPEGGLLLLWPADDLQIARFDGAGWSEPQAVLPEPVRPPMVHVAPDGEIRLVGDHSTMLLSATRPAGSLRWGPPSWRDRPQGTQWYGGAAWLADGRLLMTFGFDDSVRSSIWDPASDTWTEPVVIHRGAVPLFDGDPSAALVVDSLGRATATWRATGPGPDTSWAARCE